MRYLYDTEDGIFSIRQNSYGTWDLYMDDLCLGNYAAPDVAAHDVAMCVTGYWNWDQQRRVDKLADLSVWACEPA